MTEWYNRPLDRVYPVIFIDAIVVKVRDGQVRNKPIYVVIGVTVDGERDILGLWAGDGGEGAKFWLQVLTEIKNRGVARRVHRGLRRAQGPAGRDHHGVAARRWCSSASSTCSATRSAIASRKYWDADRPRPQTGLHRRHPRPRPWPGSRSSREKWGKPVPGDQPAVAQRLGGVRAVPGLRRRDPQDHLLHQRDRVAQRPLPAGGPGPRPLPQRAGRAEVPLPGHPIPGPHRQGQGTLDDAVEARPERLRHHLRRPHHPGRNQP